MLIDPAIAQQLQLLLKIVLAMLLGGVVGLEREARDRPAGLRTNMLMAGAAALIISLGVPLVADLTQHFGDSIRVDPGNLVQAVVLGVSFLGSGTIIRQQDQDHVKGLTTAATLLFVAVIGMAVALGQVVLAVGATLLVLITLRVIRWVELRQSA